MRITFDTEVDALTLAISGQPVARTVDAGEGRFIDLDEDGNIVAVEVLGASQGFRLQDLLGRFDLEPLLNELASSVRQAKEAKEGMVTDPALRGVLTA